MQSGAIVLCGGRSNRMGCDKATLRFGPEFMLQRIVRLLSNAIELSHIFVVASPRQQLPQLPAAVNIARDPHEFHGPLQGLATGLGEMNDRFDAIFATACDVPLLAPAFVTKMFQLLGDYDVVVPADIQHCHPLAAVYRPIVLPHIRALLNSDQRQLKLLLDRVRTLKVPVDNLRDVDPPLATLENLNQPEDYLKALAKIGFSLPNKTGE